MEAVRASNKHFSGFLLLMACPRGRRKPVDKKKNPSRGGATGNAEEESMSD
jgi:hypothetical protein